MIAATICRDRNVDHAHSSIVIQGRILGTVLLSLALLSGCSFFEEPVYNRYGELIDTKQYSQTTYVAEQVFEQAEPVTKVSKVTPVAKVDTKLAPTIAADASIPSSSIYSIQLFAAYDKSFSQRYIQQHQLQAGTYIRELEHQGRPWFVVLYGQYSAVHEAVQARKGLASSLTKSGAWIRSVAHEQHTVLPNYSLQLIASRSRNHAEKFIRRYNIGSKGYIHETVSNGAPLYLVLYGEYQYDQNARKAIPTLAKELQALKPWVRTLGHGKTAELPTFTLQLLASRSRDNAKKLISRYNIGSKGYIHQTTSNGAPLYLVLYGNYQYARDARKAIPTLSKDLKTLGPWVRSFNQGKAETLPTYSLQLMASISRDNAEKLMRDNKIGSKGSIHKIIRSGTPLYLVLYGDYQFAEDARKAIPTLSKELQELKPWVRSAKK